MSKVRGIEWSFAKNHISNFRYLFNILYTNNNNVNNVLYS